VRGAPADVSDRFSARRADQRSDVFVERTVARMSEAISGKRVPHIAALTGYVLFGYLAAERATCL
jgi:hypothetical protein